MDADTGEILGDVYRPIQKRGPKEGRFYKLYRDWLARGVVSGELTPRQLQVLMLMIYESRPDNEVLLYPQDVIKTLKMRAPTAYEAIKKLETGGYIRKEGPGRYRLNDAVSWQGRRVRNYNKMP